MTYTMLTKSLLYMPFTFLTGPYIVNVNTHSILTLKVLNFENLLVTVAQNPYGRAWGK